jgi:hypothetical protein
MTQPSVAVAAGFVSIVASLLVLVPVFVRQAEMRLGAEPSTARRRAAAAAVAAAAWLAVVAGLALSGVLRDFDARPPRITLIVVPALLACVVIALAPLGGRLAGGLPVAWLIGFQAFRVPVELVLHRLFTEGVLPVQMTWEGRNLDVLTGLAALPVAWLASRDRLPRWGAVAFNVAGLALLANIVVVAILSMPYPFRRFLEGPGNEVVFDWPFAWLPAFVVPAAFLGHLLSLRQARRYPASRPLI